MLHPRRQTTVEVKNPTQLKNQKMITHQCQKNRRGPPNAGQQTKLTPLAARRSRREKPDDQSVQTTRNQVHHGLRRHTSTRVWRVMRLLALSENQIRLRKMLLRSKEKVWHIPEGAESLPYPIRKSPHSQLQSPRFRQIRSHDRKEVAFLLSPISPSLR